MMLGVAPSEIQWYMSDLFWYMITTLEMSEVSSIRASRVIDDQTVLAWAYGCQMLKYMDIKSKYQLNLISRSMDNSLSQSSIH